MISRHSHDNHLRVTTYKMISSGYRKQYERGFKPGFAERFFSIGLIIILLEGFFFNAVLTLATSEYGVHRILGVTLFPSEVWFIFVGNTIMLASIVLRVKRDENFQRHTLLLPLIIIFLIGFLGTIYGMLNGNKYYIEDMRIVYWGVISLPPILYFSSRIRIEPLLENLSCYSVVPAIAYCCLSVAQIVFGLFSEEDSIYIYWAFPCVLILPMIFNLYESFTRPAKIYKIRAMLFSIAIVLPMHKPIIGMIVIAVLCMLVVGQKFLQLNLRKYLIIVFLLGICFLTVFSINFISGGSLEDRVRTKYLKENQPDTARDYTGGRLFIWSVGLQRWSNNPWLGTGLGSRVELIVPELGYDGEVATHNILIQILFQTGILGGSLFILSWIYWLRKSLRFILLIPNIEQKVVVVSLFVYVLTLLCCSLYGVFIGLPTIGQLFWLTVGLISGYRYAGRPFARLPKKIKI